MSVSNKAEWALKAVARMTVIIRSVMSSNSSSTISSELF